jgi:hypothetical protein
LDPAALAAAVGADAAARQPGWFPDLLDRLEAEGMVARAPDSRLTLPG